MVYDIITFRSVTPAQRAERLLRQLGIDCTLQRTPRWMEAQGCGYSLWVNNGQIYQIIPPFREQKIPFRKVYHIDDSGKTEELAL